MMAFSDFRFAFRELVRMEQGLKDGQLWCTAFLLVAWRRDNFFADHPKFYYQEKARDILTLGLWGREGDVSFL